MIKCNCNIWEGCTCGAIEEERRLIREGKSIDDANVNNENVDDDINVKGINTNKPLINCAIEIDCNYTYFKFVEVDEEIRNKDKIYSKNIGTFNGYEIYSYGYPGYYNNKNINIFGVFRGDDNKIVKCNKEVINVLEDAGCKIIIK